MKVCIIVDNVFLYEKVKGLLSDGLAVNHEYDFFFSAGHDSFVQEYCDTDFKPIRLRDQTADFFDTYDVYFSMHCKQIFPDLLVQNHRCINIHPGLNPYNRGWFPQVFSILNKMPLGVTIHEMDEQLDHGPIIYQTTIDVEDWETSDDLYQRIQAAEVVLLNEHFVDLIEGRYSVRLPAVEGNINLKKDFDELCHLNLDSQISVGAAIDLFRAGTFAGYNNLWFRDKNGIKIYIRIDLTPDFSQNSDL